MVKIETGPFTDKKIDDDLKLCDFNYILHFSSKKLLKRWIKSHQVIKFDDEEIIYVHRYPKNKETVIGIMRLKELDYFI